MSILKAPRRGLFALFAFALLACAAVPSQAQPVRILPTCGTISPAFAANSQSAILTMDVNGLLCTAASVSASITGFPTVQSTGTPISVTTSSATGTLPSGAVVVASNVGATNGAYCKLGASATTSDQLIPPNSWFAFTVGANTQLTCITSASTTTVNMVGGSGLPTGSGGGGGGGGGGAVTMASGAVASGAYSSGAFASGAYASGSVASGAFASGALASGSIAAGAQVDLLTMRGTKNAGTAAANSILAGGVYNSTPLTLTDTQQSSLQFDANGYLKTTVTNTLTALTPGDGITTGTYASGSPILGGLLLWNGTTYDRWKSSGSTGIAAAGIFQGSTALSATNGLFTNVLQGNAVLSTTNPLPVAAAAATTGGSTPYTPFVPAASDNHQTVKNGAGTSFSVTTSNNSATKNYLRLYDAGTGFNGCNSATGVIFAMEIPPTDSGFTVLTGGTNGLAFSTGLSVCVTSGFGLTDTTNATATAMYVNIAYK